MKLVKDVMTKKVVTVRDEDDVKQACKLLAKNRISGLPVMNRLSHASPKGHGGAGLMFGVDVDRVAFAVGLGMACAILIAALLGMMLPFLFRRIHIDPAIASGPIVTTANDIISVTVFLGLASAIMVW